MSKNRNRRKTKILKSIKKNKKNVNFVQIVPNFDLAYKEIRKYEKQNKMSAGVVKHF